MRRPTTLFPCEFLEEQAEELYASFGDTAVVVHTYPLLL
jgi:hypothetical protein